MLFDHEAVFHAKDQLNRMQAQNHHLILHLRFLRPYNKNNRAEPLPLQCKTNSIRIYIELAALSLTSTPECKIYQVTVFISRMFKSTIFFNLKA